VPTKRDRLAIEAGLKLTSFSARASCRLIYSPQFSAAVYSQRNDQHIWCFPPTDKREAAAAKFCVPKHAAGRASALSWISCCQISPRTSSSNRHRCAALAPGPSASRRQRWTCSFSSLHAQARSACAPLAAASPGAAASVKKAAPGRAGAAEGSASVGRCRPCERPDGGAAGARVSVPASGAPRTSPSVGGCCDGCCDGAPPGRTAPGRPPGRLRNLAVTNRRSSARPFLRLTVFRAEYSHLVRVGLRLRVSLPGSQRGYSHLSTSKPACCHMAHSCSTEK
jgi:hypothetical protein